MRNSSKLSAVLLGLVAGVSGCVAEVDGGTEELEPIAEAAQAILWNGHYYQFQVAPLSYAQARSQCLTNGYQLVSVNSASEESWLHQQQSSRGPGRWWIGLTDAIEGVWVWEDGSQPVYTNWYPGEPNDAGNDEDCAEDHGPFEYNGKWNDINCTFARKYICEGVQP